MGCHISLSHELVVTLESRYLGLWRQKGQGSNTSFTNYQLGHGRVNYFTGG